MSKPTLVPIQTARGCNGAVVAPRALASQAGMAVLRQGGSAVDAAIATNAALAVVASHSCGLGGDAFWLIWPNPEEGLQALNGSGRSASRATIETARAAGLERMPLRGPWSVTVPGAIRSWGDAHERYGRRPWASLFEPAIELANGFPASPGWIDAIEHSAPIFGPTSEWARTFRPRGRPWHPGERVTLPALRSSLELLASEGPDVAYRGRLAQQSAAYLEASGSLLRADDFAAHRSDWGTPIRTTYRGVEATSHPPNSSGAVALELLNILACFDPPSGARLDSMPGLDPAWTHLGLEAARLAMADRDTSLTDLEAMASGALERLLGAGRARELAGRIDPARVLPSVPLGAPPGGGTVYLAVADRWGGAVSMLQSNFAGFGSGLVDPATGIAFQNRGSFFSLDPSRANALAPRKRTLHTLTPGMLFRDGRPWVLHGSMGGEIQPQIFAQFVSALVDAGVDIATAVAAPRWATGVDPRTGAPSITRLEARVPRAVADALAAKGHRIEWGDDFDLSFGHEHAIELRWDDPRDTRPASMAATTDPRSEGLPAAC